MTHISLYITQNKLNQIHTLTNGDIPCKPVQRIVENDVIIGIVTETNQMIPVEPEAYQRPLDDVKVDNIETVEINNISEPISRPILDQEFLTNYGFFPVLSALKPFLLQGRNPPKAQ